MFSILKRMFGSANDRIIKRLKMEVDKINQLEPVIQALSDNELQSKTFEFKNRLQNNETLDDIMYEAFAVVREAAKRVHSMRHYDVQLIGGIILHRGMITEMRTGEGKTLVATLPAYLNALLGKGVHVVTVNDYLVKRDAEWMGRIYSFLGLSVGSIIGGMDDNERKNAYNADITHATNNELGFDFLRDNMKFSVESKVQRPFNFAIIDEVDSILIDEARTPLIISGPVDNNSTLYTEIDQLINQIQIDDYEKDEKLRTVNLTEKGINNIEQLLINNNLIAAQSGLYDFENLNLVHYINQSLKAYVLFKKNVDYLVKDNKVMIIDGFTGRIMEGRRYSDGLHQALEAKEKVAIQNENQTLASITFQNYFRLYPKLSGMTGTAMTEAAELKNIYNLDVVAVPTHHPIIRIDHNDAIYGSKEEKYQAIIKLIRECYEKGQPVLIGTISIEKSEEISDMLKQQNIAHNILNAKFHEQEAYIIAQAGRFKAITIATNMAGRGTDIMLGGNPDMMIEQLDRSQLSEDEFDQKVDQIKEQTKREKQQVIESGGLFVVGTERHESRRIDNQLRGRAGRQGDPGATIFVLSLNDDLMLIFISENTLNTLRNFGLKNNESLEHPIIDKSIETAQRKIEQHNFEIRKNLLNFDNVMDNQRKVIYEQRNDIISADNIDEFLHDMTKELIHNRIKSFILPDTYKEDWDINGLCHELYRIFGLKIEPKAIIEDDITESNIINKIETVVKELYDAKEQGHNTRLIQDAGKYILLTTLDQVWKDHLHNLDLLKESVSLRAYGQKDPLTEYKREAFDSFEHMFDNLRELFIQRVYHLHIDEEHLSADATSLEHKELPAAQQNRADHINRNYNASDRIMKITVKPRQSYVKPSDRIADDASSWGKISRNELCPCGSERKYKHCHGKDD